MKALIRFILGAAALYPARAVLADDGTIRVAVSVDVTPEGRAVARPAPNRPVFYLPVVSGDQDRGDILVYYQRPPPPDARIDDQLKTVLSAQGYQIAAEPSTASVVLDFQWGYIAPYVVTRGGMHRPAPGRPINVGRLLNSRGWITNWPEMATYILGDRWTDYAAEAVNGVADPATQEIFNVLRDAEPGPDHVGARYYVLISALDPQAFLQHRQVLLWRAHISTEYWGHYIDEVLPTLIDTGVLAAGRETNTPQIFTVPLAGWMPMGKTGNSSLTEYQIPAPDKKS